MLPEYLTSTRSDLRPQINQLLNHSIFYSTLVVLLVYRRPMKDQCTPSYRSISPSQSMWVLRIIQSKANQNSGPGNICSSSFRNKAILHFTLFGLWSQSVYSYSKRVEYAEAWFHSRGCVEMCVNQLRERGPILWRKYTIGFDDALNEMKGEYRHATGKRNTLCISVVCNKIVRQVVITMVFLWCSLFVVIFSLLILLLIFNLGTH